MSAAAAKKNPAKIVLLNLQESKRNTSVYVNETTYEIDEQGLCAVGNTKDAEKMLSGKNWTRWDGKDPTQRLAEAKAARRAEYKQGHDAAEQANADKDIKGLVDDRLKELGLFDAIQQMKAAAARVERMADAAEAPAPVEDDPDPAGDEGSGGGEGEGEGSGEGEGEDPVKFFGDSGAEYVVPEDGSEWPDMVDDMPMDYIRAAATAYQLDFPHNIGKDKLMERVTAAMYDK